MTCRLVDENANQYSEDATKNYEDETNTLLLHAASPNHCLPNKKHYNSMLRQRRNMLVQNALYYLRIRYFAWRVIPTKYARSLWHNISFLLYHLCVRMDIFDYRTKG